MKIPLMLVREWMDDRKIDWCAFTAPNGEGVSIGIPSEYIVGLKKRYGSDLQLTCRFALEQLETLPASPTVLDGPAYARLEQAFKGWEFRIAATEETDGYASVEDAIRAVTERYNRLYGEGWQYFYTTTHSPEAVTGGVGGSRFLIHRQRPTQ
jgi:hypothetical protein